MALKNLKYIRPTSTRNIGTKLIVEFENDMVSMIDIPAPGEKKQVLFRRPGQKKKRVLKHDVLVAFDGNNIKHEKSAYNLIKNYITYLNYYEDETYFTKFDYLLYISHQDTPDRFVLKNKKKLEKLKKKAEDKILCFIVPDRVLSNDFNLQLHGIFRVDKTFAIERYPRKMLIEQMKKAMPVQFEWMILNKPKAYK